MRPFWDRSQIAGPSPVRSSPQFEPHVGRPNRKGLFTWRIFAPAQPTHPVASVRNYCSGGITRHRVRRHRVISALQIGPDRCKTRQKSELSGRCRFIGEERWDICAQQSGIGRSQELKQKPQTLKYQNLLPHSPSQLPQHKMLSRVFFCGSEWSQLSLQILINLFHLQYCSPCCNGARLEV